MSSTFTPATPENSTIFPEEGEYMAAANLKVLPQGTTKSTTLIEKINGGILMVIQKVTAPTISVSTATIGLLLVMVGQFGAGIWWAASTSKDSARYAEELKAVQAENATLKVYIDNLREKQIKMEATQDNLVREQQVLNLMIQKGK